MADKPVSALDYLNKPEKYTSFSVCALFGNDTFLRHQALLFLRNVVLGEEGEFSLTTFDGQTATFRDVHEELSTVAMFGGRRLVVIEDADDFVANYREQLEAYVAHPSRSSVLALELSSLPGNTRLYKSIAAKGLLIDCNIDSKTPPIERLCKWITDWAKQRHNITVPLDTAEVLVELIGPEPGLLDQELAKLALLVDQDQTVTPDLVQQTVAGWRVRTTWDMLDAALEGNVAEALSQLDRLLASGEQPIGLLAQISASLRKLAAATSLVIQAEQAGKRIDLRNVLAQVRVPSFVLQKAERQLRFLGRKRAMQLYRWLLQADLDLKGDSSLSPRLVLERLIIKLAAKQNPVKQK